MIPVQTIPVAPDPLSCCSSTQQEYSLLHTCTKHCEPSGIAWLLDHDGKAGRSSRDTIPHEVGLPLCGYPLMVCLYCLSESVRKSLTHQQPTYNAFLLTRPSPSSSSSLCLSHVTDTYIASHTSQNPNPLHPHKAYFLLLVLLHHPRPSLFCPLYLTTCSSSIQQQTRSTKIRVPGSVSDSPKSL